MVNNNVVNMQFYYISDNFIESDWMTRKQIIKSDLIIFQIPMELIKYHLNWMTLSETNTFW